MLEASPQLKIVRQITKLTESTYLINFPYRHNPNAEFSPLRGIVERPSDNSRVHRVAKLDLNQHPSFFKHKFASGPEPVGLEVNGRKGRRVVCVLYGDKSRYSVFDLDTAAVDEDDVEYEEAENGEDEDQIMEDGS